jgi:23S rRNA (guanosine2251-2'-O)-methyltransferase
VSKPSREYIYGINPCFEVVRAGRRKVYEAYLNQATRNNPRLKKLVTLLEREEIPVNWVEKGRLIDLSKSRENQGAVIKAAPYWYVDYEPLYADSRLLLLDNVEDPHNVGGILRSAEIFGFNSVFLPTKGVPEIYPSIVKVSAGASEFMQIARARSANQYVKRALEEGFTIAALDAKGTTSLDDIQPGSIDKLLLVIGGEDKSVGQFILNEAQIVLRIPQVGRINSLNASVAAGIAMHSMAKAVKNHG